MEPAKRFAYRLALMLLMLIIAAAAAVVSAAGRREPPPASAEEHAYLLREYQDQIGVFRPENADPVRMIHVDVDTLPAADQLELRGEGIPVPDEEKLLSLIEDLES